jgi:hypothetical protein
MMENGGDAEELVRHPPAFMFKLINDDMLSRCWRYLYVVIVKRQRNHCEVTVLLILKYLCFVCAWWKPVSPDVALMLNVNPHHTIIDW